MGHDGNQEIAIRTDPDPPQVEPDGTGQQGIGGGDHMEESKEHGGHRQLGRAEQESQLAGPGGLIEERREARHQ